jgi:dihydrodipicolinate synthase/N-acetylneuraminate lyase
MKCHAELYNYYDFIRDTKDDDFAVVSAGQMKHFLFGYLIGSPAYLCALTPFAPQVGVRFYEAMKKGSIEEARQMIFDYEEPLLEVTIPLEYPQCYKSALYLRGIYKTQLVRPPKKSNTPDDLSPLRQFLQERGLLKKS